MTKKGDRMCFATLEDLTGKIECIVFPKVFVEHFELLEGDEPLVMTGTVNLSETPKKFFPNKIQLMKDESEERVTSVRINIDTGLLNDFSMNKLKQVLLSYRGSVPTHLIFQSKEGRAKMDLSENFLVNPTPQMAAKVNEILNNNSVSFIVDGKLESGV